MTQFIQFHILTSYPPSNLNRDDLGRPKSAMFGGKNRLRISSQCLKRTWRTSEQFEVALDGHIGARTRRVGEFALDILLGAGIKEADALKWSHAIATRFGKVSNAKPAKREDIRTQQLVHISPAERREVEELARVLAEEKRAPVDADLKILRRDHGAADIAMFGRMLADSPSYNTEAAVQVAHAITVHAVDVEDDYFTAVDDLNRPSASADGDDDHHDSGAGHIGELGFGAGVFYLYICVDRDLLERNLQGNRELANKTIAALLEAASKTSPSGKQNSFASRALAHFVLAEKGTEQPRSLSSAFLRPAPIDNPLEGAIEQLLQTRRNFAQVYGEEPASASFNVLTGDGSMKTVVDFVGEP